MAAFVVAASLVWWHVHADDLFYVVGLEEPASSLLGPLLPAVAAGLLVAMSLLVVDAAVGPVAGVVAALVMMALPGFLPLHRSSLSGPPLAAFTVMMVGIMVHAPRFSVAYGGLAAVAAVYIDPAGLGLPLAAVAWVAVLRTAGGNGTARRIGLALVPLVVALAAARWTGDAWPDHGVLGWRGHLDEGLRAAGTVVGDQVAPTLGTGALRWFVIADMSLLVLAALVAAWRTAATVGATMARRFMLASGITVAGLAVGMSLRWLLMPDTFAPALAAVFPVVALLTLATVAAVASLWPRWPTWGRALVILLAIGWLQAAVRA